MTHNKDMSPWSQSVLFLFTKDPPSTKKQHPLAKSSVTFRAAIHKAGNELCRHNAAAFLEGDPTWRRQKKWQNMLTSHNVTSVSWNGGMLNEENGKGSMLHANHTLVGWGMGYRAEGGLSQFSGRRFWWSLAWSSHNPAAIQKQQINNETKQCLRTRKLINLIKQYFGSMLYIVVQSNVVVVWFNAV